MKEEGERERGGSKVRICRFTDGGLVYIIIILDPGYTYLCEYPAIFIAYAATALGNFVIDGWGGWKLDNRMRLEPSSGGELSSRGYLPLSLSLSLSFLYNICKFLIKNIVYKLFLYFPLILLIF